MHTGKWKKKKKAKYECQGSFTEYYRDPKQTFSTSSMLTLALRFILILLPCKILATSSWCSVSVGLFQSGCTCFTKLDGLLDSHLASSLHAAELYWLIAQLLEFAIPHDEENIIHVPLPIFMRICRVLSKTRLILLTTSFVLLPSGRVQSKCQVGANTAPLLKMNSYPPGLLHP